MSQLTSEFKDVFSGLGKYKNIKAKLIVDKNVTPIAHKPRKIPYNLAKKATEEEQPHNLEAIRFCSDMRAPNTAILRPVTEALTIEDQKFRLEGATVFSILEMNEGYHQLELDEHSRHINLLWNNL